MKPSNKWTQAIAVELCKKIEAICPQFGCHVALTGGLLYKDGERKDCDILFYRIRQVETINFDGLWKALEAIGVCKMSGFGWCYKAEYFPTGNADDWYKLDMFSPEEFGGEDYNADPADKIQPERDPLNASNAGHICGACECVVGQDGGCGCNPHDA